MSWTNSPISRREFVLGGVTALVAVACSKGGGSTPPPSSPPPGASIQQLTKGAVQLSLIQAQDEVPKGRSLFSFGLSTPDGGLLRGGAPVVFAAPDETTKPLGPFRAGYHQFAPASDFNDKTIPRSPITGFYTVELDIPSPGTWLLAAVTSTGQGRGVGVGASPVKAQVPNEVGSKATPVKTPVATTERKLEEICTRKPPDPMHYVSLDLALKNGKPTVVSFATPLLCSSRMCGPVVDEQLLVFQSVGKEKANFIHVEEFLPGRDLDPPPATLQNQSPPFKEWHLTTEPWVFVIDKRGTIREAFPGPVVAAQIEAALRPLL
jgi:hypothetical protein